MVKPILHDRVLWAAVLAALLFYTGLIFFYKKNIDLTWLFNQPERFLMLVLLYPFLEEVVFRGFLQSILLRWAICQRKWMGISVANLLASFIFSVTHLLYHSIFWSIVVYFPSIIFGYFRDKYQSIKPCIALHIFFN